MPVNPKYLEALKLQAEAAKKRLQEVRVKDVMNIKSTETGRLPSSIVALSNTPKHEKLSISQIIEQQRAAKEKHDETHQVVVPSSQELAKAYLASALGAVDWNEQQRQAITFGQQGKSFVLIGAAGTGKTTTLKGVLQALTINELITPLQSGTKYLSTGSPGIALVSYTRRAVRQIARQMPPELRAHCLTIHKLLEFEPIFYEVPDAEGNLKKTMRFEPTKHAGNPLPKELRRVVVDESSMVSTELFQMLKEALPPNCQFIFLGDLHQLPPVYGESVLAAKLQELPVVELAHVYRQALDSPIIRLATDIKDGKEVPIKEKQRMVSPDGKSNVIINPWPKQLSSEDAMDAVAHQMKTVINSGNFNEEEDVVLMPFNKSLGTLELNLHIANTLALRRGAIVHHVIAGFIHWYLAIGDRVLVDKQDCIIRGIDRNPKYVGKLPLEPSDTLDRWGTYQDEKEHHHVEETDEDVDDLLERMASQQVDDKTNQASHVLTLESLDTGAIWKVGEVGTYNSMVFSYALTVHKSQGSEWRRVFLFLHSSHHAMCSRELVYTAVTRAREDLIILCEPDRRDSKGTLSKAALNPRIKGNTLSEKLEWLRVRSAEKMKGKGEDDDLIGK
jgi:exodeoxyribonuclease V alpha subunit